MILYDSKGVKKKVILQTYYNLDGDYMLFDSNPLHGKTFENVNVVITKEYIRLTHMNIAVNVVRIDGQEPIECEYLSHIEDGDTLVVKLCQDWG